MPRYRPVQNDTLYVIRSTSPATYDHRRMKTGHPVRSGVLKHSTGCVVVGWVTTSEFQLLYVQPFLSFLASIIQNHHSRAPRHLHPAEAASDTVNILDRRLCHVVPRICSFADYLAISPDCNTATEPCRRGAETVIVARPRASTLLKCFAYHPH